jgi:hypothetical protein
LFATSPCIPSIEYTLPSLDQEISLKTILKIMKITAMGSDKKWSTYMRPHHTFSWFSMKSKIVLVFCLASGTHVISRTSRIFLCLCVLFFYFVFCKISKINKKWWCRSNAWIFLSLYIGPTPNFSLPTQVQWPSSNLIKLKQNEKIKNHFF